jgi:uncharacterized protein YggE
MKTGVKIATIAIMIMAMAIGSVMLFGKAQAADPADPKNELTVTGSGIIKVTADKFSITLTIQTKDKSARTAQQDNDKKANALIDALTKAGVSRTDLVTSNYSLDPSYKWDPVNNQNLLDGYMATYSLRATVYDIKKMGEIIDIATNNGATNIGGISYELKKTDTYRQEALKLAMRDAKTKATIALSEYGRKVTGMKVIYINDAGPVAMTRNAMKAGGVGAADEAGYAPDIIADAMTITSSVSVVFTY